MVQVTGGGCIRGGPFPGIRQFRSVGIIMIVERSVSYPPKAQDATKESSNMVFSLFRGGAREREVKRAVADRLSILISRFMSSL